MCAECRQPRSTKTKCVWDEGTVCVVIARVLPCVFACKHLQEKPFNNPVVTATPGSQLQYRQTCNAHEPPSPTAGSKGAPSAPPRYVIPD